MTREEVLDSLRNAKISPGDCIMIHGDSAVAFQLKEHNMDKKLSLLFKLILNYIGKEGTLVVPTFTYSATNNEIFDVKNTTSKVGYFSEFFRNIPGVLRSSHPIFSVAAYGKYKEIFANSSLKECFGKNSSFDLLHTLDGKIMNLGCSFDFITYAHYVEEKLKVKYRYYKKFKGAIKKDASLIKKTTRYFVGDRSINYKLDLSKLKEKLIIENKLKIVPFGRFACFTVSCHDFFNTSRNSIKSDEYFLIRENSIKQKK